jgi:ribosomal protein L29
MDQKQLDSLKAMSRDERVAYLKNHRSELLDMKQASAVNGGAGSNVKNPGTEEGVFENNYYTSFGFTCDGEVVC